jgi:hypothetical protein
MAYSSSYTFYSDIIISDLNTSDIITFELISEYQPTSGLWTGSLDTSDRLYIDNLSQAYGGYPFATSSFDANGFVTAINSPNSIQLTSTLGQFYGSNYMQLASFASGSMISSSLYNQYGEINNSFTLSYGDKIVIKSYDGKYQILSVLNVSIDNSSKVVNINTYPNIDSAFVNNPSNVKEFLLVKKLQDEQNIIMSFTKPPGDTSYGFIIPENINLDVLNNISSIQSNVQTQLLSTQQNSQ